MPNPTESPRPRSVHIIRLLNAATAIASLVRYVYTHNLLYLGVAVLAVVCFLVPSMKRHNRG